jgi:predicted small secreted protein
MTSLVAFGINILGAFAGITICLLLPAFVSDPTLSGRKILKALAYAFLAAIPIAGLAM